MFTKLFIKLIGVYLSLIDKLHILKEHIFVDFHIHTYIYECMSLCIYIHTQAYIERCTLFIYIHIYMNEIITIIKKTNISITPKVLCPWVFPNLHNKRPKLEDGCSWTRRTLLGFYPIACPPSQRWGWMAQASLYSLSWDCKLVFLWTIIIIYIF